MAITTRWDQIREFLVHEQKQLTLFVRGLIKDTADRDAEDIIQDVVYNLFEKGDISEPIEHLGAYIYRALRNRVIDTFRKRKPDTSLDEPLLEDEDMRLADVIADTRQDLTQSIEVKDLYDRAMTIVKKMPVRDQALIIATEIEGYTFAELSEMWDAPIGTLLSQKSRALNKLRTALKNELYE
jgi:RNA polymerase sigma factor (sigma-70 family)